MTAYLQTEYPKLVHTDDLGLSYYSDKMSAILLNVKDLKNVEKQQQTIKNQQKQIDDMNERFNSN